MMKGTVSRRSAIDGRKRALGVAGALGSAKPAGAQGGGDVALVVDAVGAGPARGLQVPDRPVRGGQPGHQGGVRADLERDLRRPARRRFRQRPGAEHRHPPAVLRRDQLLAQRPARAVQRRHPDGRPGEVLSRRQPHLRGREGRLWRRRHRRHRGQHAVAAHRPDEEGRHRERPEDLGRAARRRAQDAGRRHLRRAAALRQEQHDHAGLHLLRAPGRRPGVHAGSARSRSTARNR